MPLSVMIWALFVVPLWMLFAQLPAALVSAEAPSPSLLTAGFVGAMLLVFVLDRRFGSPGPARRLWPERPRTMLFALVAGLGVTILASELGNIGAHMADITAPTDDEAELGAPWEIAMVSTAFRLTLLLVVIGVSLRSLLAIHRPWTAVVLAALLGALPAPLHLWPQLGLMMALPAWLFRHTRSMALALASYLAMLLLPLADVAGVSLGIRGFDVVDPDAFVFQPIWFNLVGAALVAAGVAPLLHIFEAEQAAIDDTSPADDDAPR